MKTFLKSASESLNVSWVSEEFKEGTHPSVESNPSSFSFFYHAQASLWYDPACKAKTISWDELQLRLELLHKQRVHTDWIDNRIDNWFRRELAARNTINEMKLLIGSMPSVCSWVEPLHAPLSAHMWFYISKYVQVNYIMNKSHKAACHLCCLLQLCNY